MQVVGFGVSLLIFWGLHGKFFSHGGFCLSRNAQNFFAKGSKTVGWRFACHPDLSYLPQITRIFTDFFFFSFDSLSCCAKITPFGRDYCFVRHSSSKLDSALTYRKKSLDRLTQILLLRSICRSRRFFLTIFFSRNSQNSRIFYRFACHPDLSYLPQIARIFTDYFFLFWFAYFMLCIKCRSSDWHRFLLLRSICRSRRICLSRNARNARNFFAKGSKTVGWRFACHPDLSYLPQITRIFTTYGRLVINLRSEEIRVFRQKRGRHSRQGLGRYICVSWVRNRELRYRYRNRA